MRTLWRNCPDLLIRHLTEEAVRSGRVSHARGYLCVEALRLPDGRVFWFMQGDPSSEEKVRRAIGPRRRQGTVRV
jgi:hypothetical protein